MIVKKKLKVSFKFLTLLGIVLLCNYFFLYFKFQKRTYGIPFVYYYVDRDLEIHKNATNFYIDILFATLVGLCFWKLLGFLKEILLKKRFSLSEIFILSILSYFGYAIFLLISKVFNGYYLKNTKSQPYLIFDEIIIQKKEFAFFFACYLFFSIVLLISVALFLKNRNNSN